MYWTNDSRANRKRIASLIWHLEHIRPGILRIPVYLGQEALFVAVELMFGYLLLLFD